MKSEDQQSIPKILKPFVPEIFLCSHFAELFNSIGRIEQSANYDGNLIYPISFSSDETY
jgi:hypothetical protein